jgi:hypothetical protein
MALQDLVLFARFAYTARSPVLILLFLNGESQPFAFFIFEFDRAGQKGLA